HNIVDSVLERRKADGSLDTTFGSAGTGQVVQDFGLHEEVNSGSAFDALDQSYPNSLVVQPDGAILVAGLARYPRRSDGAGFAARFGANGTLDTNFGSGGEVVLVNQPLHLGDLLFIGPSAVAVLEPRFEDMTMTTVMLQPDGKILLGTNDGIL